MLVLYRAVFPYAVSSSGVFAASFPMAQEHGGIHFNMVCRYDSQIRIDCSLRFLFYVLSEKQYFFLFTLSVKIYILIMENLHIFSFCEAAYMNFTMENILFLGSVLIFLSILMTKASHKLGIPTLLLFLFLGMIFGSDGLGLHFYSVEQAQFIGIVALSIILFSGGMDTQIKQIKPVLAQGVLLSTFGVVFTTVFTGLFIFCLFQLDIIPITLTLATSFLLAATMSSTDSASVFNLLRSQQMELKDNLRPILELESGSNDPIAYMLTIALIQYIVDPETISGFGVFLRFLVQFIVGIGFGILSGFGMVKLLNTINLKNTMLYPLLLLVLVFITSTATVYFNGNGYLAVYLAGIIFGNSKCKFRREINTFMDGVTWLFQIVMFLVLGLLVNPHEMWQVAVFALVIGIFMMFVSRPLSVFICLLPFKGMSNKAKLFVSWVGLRGAVPIIFATYPMVAGVDYSNQLFNMVFFITLVSLIFQGMTISRSAVYFDLKDENEIIEKSFDVELSEDINSVLKEELVRNDLAGKKLSEIKMKQGMLVMLIKRDMKYLIPNGSTILLEGDKLLIIEETNEKSGKE